MYAWRLSLLSLALLLLTDLQAAAELRINDLDVYLNDHEVTVQVVALGALGPALQPHRPFVAAPGLATT